MNSVPCLGAWGQRSRGLRLEQEEPGSQRGEGSLCLSFCLFSWIKFPSCFCLSVFRRSCYSLTHHVPDQPLAPSAFPAQVASTDGCFVLRLQFTSLWGGSQTASLSPWLPVATPWAPVVEGAYRYGHLQRVRFSGKGGQAWRAWLGPPRTVISGGCRETQQGWAQKARGPRW